MSMILVMTLCLFGFRVLEFHIGWMHLVARGRISRIWYVFCSPGSLLQVVECLLYVLRNMIGKML